MKFILNGKEVELDVEPTMPLLWALRDELNMTGTKYGCGISSCGACTVLMDGVAHRTCVLPIAAVEGKEITTIEGLQSNGQLNELQKAWIDIQVPQCGYCQSGMLMAAEGLLREIPNPSEEDIRQRISNICRCGTYPRIIKAIKSAIEMRTNSNSLLG